MNAAAVARIAAWKVVADTELPANTKITVEDGWVTVHPRGGRPTRTPYGPTDTPESLYNAIKRAGQTPPQGDNRTTIKQPPAGPERNNK